MRKHTPGPWLVDGEFDVVAECDDFGRHTLLIRAGRNDVAYVANNSNEQQKNSDAYLIASAPDLLAALLALYDKRTDKSMADARAAIDKAKGGQ